MCSIASTQKRNHIVKYSHLSQTHSLPRSSFQTINGCLSEPQYAAPCKYAAAIHLSGQQKVVRLRLVPLRRFRPCQPAGAPNPWSPQRLIPRPQHPTYLGAGNDHKAGHIPDLASHHAPTGFYISLDNSRPPLSSHEFQPGSCLCSIGSPGLLATPGGVVCRTSKDHGGMPTGGDDGTCAAEHQRLDATQQGRQSLRP
jgi:hypothetical protein